MKKDDEKHDPFDYEDTLTYSNYSGQNHGHTAKKKSNRVSSFSIMLFSISFLIIIMAVLSLYGILTNAHPSWSRGMGQVSEEKLSGVKRGFLNKATDSEVEEKQKNRMKDAAMLDVFVDDLEKQERVMMKVNEERVARKLSADLVGKSIDQTIIRINMAGLYDGETVLGEIAKDLNRSRNEISDIYLFTNKLNNYKDVKPAYKGNNAIVAIEIFERREQISKLISQLE